ncbi:MAG: hypothetical protein ACXW13_00125 [Burkholderiaceae bacterium]
MDLDGTLAHYEGWKGPTHIGAPIPVMVDRVKAWLAAGQPVKIFTARVATPDVMERDHIRAAIRVWCIDNIGAPLEITCKKDMAMVELWDDRAVRVRRNTGECISELD